MKMMLELVYKLGEWILGLLTELRRIFCRNEEQPVHTSTIGKKGL